MVSFKAFQNLSFYLFTFGIMISLQLRGYAVLSFYKYHQPGVVVHAFDPTTSWEAEAGQPSLQNGFQARRSDIVRTCLRKKKKPQT